MNTARVYKDIDGNDRTIWQMVNNEPAWAASRIQQAEKYEALLMQWHEQQKDRVGRNGNAPGHGHSTPGIWDSDNGEIAGHECAECALFELASKLSA